MTHNRPDDQWDALLESLERLCALFWGPNEDQCNLLHDPAYWAPFHIFDTDDDCGTAPVIDGLRTLLAEFNTPALLCDHLEASYVRLFVNTRGGISAPLYASCYQDEDQPQLMGGAAQQMQRTLDRIGLAISPELGQPPDHLAIAIEVVYYFLNRAETPWHLQGLQDAAEFIDDFLGPWVQRFTKRLEPETHCRFYPLLAQLLQCVLSSIASHTSQRT